MTVKEAIKILENISNCNYNIWSTREAIKMAITALSAQQDAEKNNQLTYEELLKMDGKPVWIVGERIDPCWDIVAVNRDRDYVYFRHKNMGMFQENGYGKTWFAYSNEI